MVSFQCSTLCACVTVKCNCDLDYSHGNWDSLHSTVDKTVMKHDA